MIKAKTLAHIKENIDLMEVDGNVFEMILDRDFYRLNFFIYLSLTPDFDRDNKTRQYFYGRVPIPGPKMVLLKKMDKNTLLWLLQEIDDTRCEMLAWIEEWMDGRDVWMLV